MLQFWVLGRGVGGGKISEQTERENRIRLFTKALQKTILTRVFGLEDMSMEPELCKY